MELEKMIINFYENSNIETNASMIRLNFMSYLKQQWQESEDDDYRELAIKLNKMTAKDVFNIFKRRGYEYVGRPCEISKAVIKRRGIKYV